jgi:GTPase SAR1 family protein
LVYDITLKDSFLNTQRWLGELKQFAEPDCIIMLVGNKLDLVNTNKSRRQVTFEEANLFAKENKLIFFETSALSNLRVNECFEDLIQEIYNERRKVNNKYKNNNDKGDNNSIKLNNKKNNDKKNNSCYEC